jgi:catechol 2,3-dioxygenase-like lactoylglutathione lyase family enzyme
MAVMLYVSDVERSVNFYKDTLEFHASDLGRNLLDISVQKPLVPAAIPVQPH